MFKLNLHPKNLTIPEIAQKLWDDYTHGQPSTKKAVWDLYMTDFQRIQIFNQSLSPSSPFLQQIKVAFFALKVVESEPLNNSETEQ